MRPPTTIIGPQFSANLLVVTLLNNNRHTVSVVLSFTHAFFICMSPLRSPFWSFPYANLYGLSLPIRPFQGPLYTAIGPFFPVLPTGRGFGVFCTGSAGYQAVKSILFNIFDTVHQWPDSEQINVLDKRRSDCRVARRRRRRPNTYVQHIIRQGCPTGGPRGQLIRPAKQS